MQTFSYLDDYLYKQSIGDLQMVIQRLDPNIASVGFMENGKPIQIPDGVSVSIRNNPCGTHRQ